MQDLDVIFSSLPGQVNGNAHLRHIGRFCTVEFMLEVGSTPWHFRVKDGVLEAPLKGPLQMKRWQFAIRAEADVWREFWQATPRPGYNDIFAMTAYGHGRIDGDVAPLLSDLRFIKELLALPRGQVSTGDDA